MAASLGSVAVSGAFVQRASWRRFLDSSVENQYRDWYFDQVLPVLRGGGFLALAIWIPLPPLWEAWGGEDAELVRISNWAVVAPTVIVALAFTYTRLGTWILVSSTLAMAVQSLDLIWLFTTFYGPTSGAVAMAALFGVFLPVTVRFPARWTTLIVVTVTTVSVALWVRSIRQGDTSLAEVWPYLVFITTLATVVLFVAVVTESGMRRQFVAETTVQASQLLLRRYAPAAVADRIISGEAEAVGRPQRMRVTALSSDVAGFTALADQIDPESLSQIIDEYIAAMSDAVEGQYGAITEYAGDGLTAIFGAPEEMELADQVRHAVSAATAMHTRLDALNRSWFQLGIEQPLKVRIGINTGVLSVGTFGSSGRATYTAIGLQMNIAARIQAECEPGTTLLSSSSWHLVKEDVPCKPRGEVMVKGVHFPISIYAPVT